MATGGPTCVPMCWSKFDAGDADGGSGACQPGPTLAVATAGDPHAKGTHCPLPFAKRLKRLEVDADLAVRLECRVAMIEPRSAPSPTS